MTDKLNENDYEERFKVLAVDKIDWPRTIQKLIRAKYNIKVAYPDPIWEAELPDVISIEGKEYNIPMNHLGRYPDTSAECEKHLLRLWQDMMNKK